jgi:hypothetical protein
MRDDDPDYKGKEQFFEPVEVTAERPVKNASGRGGVEDATAEPNEKRSISTVRKDKRQEQDDADKKSEQSAHFPDQKFIDDLPPTQPPKEDKPTK